MDQLDPKSPYNNPYLGAAHGTAEVTVSSIDANGLPVDVSRSEHTLHRLASGMLRTGADLVRGGVAANDIAEQRLDICRQCEYYHGETYRCTVCGCVMPLKTKVAKAKCPLEQPKWDSVYPVPDV